MLDLKKILKKGYPDSSGYVDYITTFKYSSITISQINELLQIIQKDFPKTTDKQVSIKIKDNEVKATFFTLELPGKNSGLFDKENYVFD